MSTKIDNWDAPIAPFDEDAWMKVGCGCPGCLENDSYYEAIDSRNHLTKYTCRKLKAYNESLPLRNHIRACNLVKPTAFKPATKFQINEWVSWLSDKEALQTLTLERAKYTNYKFDSKEMEKQLSRCWPNERLILLNSVKWNMYEMYTKEQQQLFNKYDKTEKAYKELLQHVNTHGQLIKEVPVFEHKKAEETSNLPKKLGRRAARHAREDSPVEKTYTRAEFREMARASENKEVSSEDE